MKRVLIIGAGDLGQQIAHYVSESTEHTIVGYVDDWANAGDIRRGYPVLGLITSMFIMVSSLFGSVL